MPLADAVGALAAFPAACAKAGSEGDAGGRGPWAEDMDMAVSLASRLSYKVEVVGVTTGNDTQFKNFSKLSNFSKKLDQ